MYLVYTVDIAKWFQVSYKTDKHYLAMFTNSISTLNRLFINILNTIISLVCLYEFEYV